MAANDNESQKDLADSSWTGRREGRAALRSGLFLACLGTGFAGAYGLAPMWGMVLPSAVLAYLSLTPANDNE